MIRPSTRVRYALRMMIELAIREGDGPVLLREVAKAQRISGKYLEQLAIPLRRSGLVRAARGPNGGYELTRPAEHITALEIIEAVEGPVRLLDCEEDIEACTRARACAARGFWARIGDAITGVLTETTLASLREEQLAFEGRTVSTYQI